VNMVSNRVSRVRRGMVAAMGTVVLVLSLAVCGSASAATGCDAWTYRSGEHGTVVAMNKSCGYIAVRHYYDPVWSGSNFWTPWHGGYGSTYSTQNTPVLVMVQGQG
jgi:hypothetical protein